MKKESYNHLVIIKQLLEKCLKKDPLDNYITPAIPVWKYDLEEMLELTNKILLSNEQLSK